MKNNETLGFGDILIYSTLLMLAMKLTGIFSASWMAIYRFSFFVVAYLAIYFTIDLVIAVISAVIKKREE